MGNSKKGLSAAEIAAHLAMDTMTVRKWLKHDGIKPVEIDKRNCKYYDRSAIAKVAVHKQIGRPDGEPNIDPETGLTWAQKLSKEKSIELALANRRQEGLDAKELLMVADHQKILSEVVSRIEQVPGKAQSELGINSTQVLGLRRMLDEALETAAKSVEEVWR